MSYRVMRLDYWDYREPTGHVFEDEKAALAKADELQRKSDQILRDPLSCYIVERDEFHPKGREKEKA